MLAAGRLIGPKLIAPTLNSSNIILARKYSIMSPDMGYSNDTVGPWPRTKEEREIAAKKYNLIPEDYEPYDEGEALGDYPKLPAIGTMNRDRYDDYDDPIDMRFYGEPFHLHADLYRYERVDPLKHEKMDVPLWQKLVVMLGPLLGMFLFLRASERYDININHPFKQRGPFPDQKLYAFPASDSGNHHHH